MVTKARGSFGSEPGLIRVGARVGFVRRDWCFAMGAVGGKEAKFGRLLRRRAWIEEKERAQGDQSYESRALRE
jgi:hypothetical protein